MQETNSLQDPHNGGGGGGGVNGGHQQQQHMSMSNFDLPSTHDDFFEQILSAASPWPDLSKSQPPWEAQHHSLPMPPLSNLNSAADDQAYHFDDQSSALLASKLQQYHINGSDGGASAAAAAAKALMLQQQLLLSRALTGTGLRSPTGAAGGNGLLGVPLSLTGGDQNEAIAHPANDNKFEALFNGFTGSLGQTSSQPHHFHHPQGGEMQAQSFGAPSAPPPMNQGLASTGSASTGGGAAPAQPKQQRVRARRGQATDPHSIAERLRRERIAERMKALQELVPNANKTDKASMLDEIIDYVKFLQLQVKVLSMSRLGGAAAVAPLVADMSSEGGDCIQGNGGRSSNGTQAQAASSSNNDSMTMTEQQVAKLMEEDMGTAMQYLQGKGLCLMPISLATAISTSTCHTRNTIANSLLQAAGGGGGGGPSSPSMSVLTVQSAATMGNATPDPSVKDAASVSKP